MEFGELTTFYLFYFFYRFCIIIFIHVGCIWERKYLNWLAFLSSNIQKWGTHFSSSSFPKIKKNHSKPYNNKLFTKRKKFLIEIQTEILFEIHFFLKLAWLTLIFMYETRQKAEVKKTTYRSSPWDEQIDGELYGG